MSFFGKNIKKIRSVKGLSQQAFAELFDLKRGTLGAYEEGRSEPKIETIIKIANYFSIKIDTLLTDELTVNELLKFKEDLTTYAEDVKREQFAVVPCITDSTSADYISLYNKDTFISELPILQLPINPSKKFRGFTVFNLEMTTHDKGFFPKDVVVGEKVPQDVIKKLNNGTLVFALVDDQILFRRLYTASNGLVFRADHKNIDDLIFDVKDIKELWRVRYVFCRRIPEFADMVEDRLLIIEQQLLKLNERL
ncbi:helix-turn-helix domain-containing protein [Aquimarina rhabdastrellae]